MPETKPKIKPEWFPDAKGYKFRAVCPTCGQTRVFSWITAKDAFACNVELPRQHFLREEQLEKTWKEHAEDSVKAFLGKQKDIVLEEPLTINTTITCRRTHVPNVRTAGMAGALYQGSIEFKRSLGDVLQNLKNELPPEVWSFLYIRLEEIKDNPEIKSYVELQKPGYTWDDGMRLIERRRTAFATTTNESQITEARAKALEQYMPQKITITDSKPLDHKQTEAVIKKVQAERAQTGSSELVLIPPKNKEQPAGGKGVLATGGTTELFDTEMKEHSKFQAESARRTEEYYQSLGIGDLELDCKHRASSSATRVRDVITGQRDSFSCNQCGKPTPREKLLAQVNQK